MATKNVIECNMEMEKLIESYYLSNVIMQILIFCNPNSSCLITF